MSNPRPVASGRQLPLDPNDVYDIAARWIKRRRSDPKINGELLGPNWFSTLPIDILLDLIFPLLGIDDIIALRRVNKFLFLLTHEPLVWKRTINKMTIPLPPFRPTFPYVDNFRGYELEQMVSRSVSADDNWRRDATKPHQYQFLSLYDEILDMKLTPGGKYLIASVQEGAEYCIKIFHMDHPAGIHPCAIASAPTRGKAFNIQAQYMEHLDGQTKIQGIMILYTLRVITYPGHETAVGVDANSFSARETINPPTPLTYQLSAIFAQLPILEGMTHPDSHFQSDLYKSRVKKLPIETPFCDVLTITSNRPFDDPQLFLYDNKPYAAAMIQHDSSIIILDLTTKMRSWMYCLPDALFPAPFTSKVNTFRVLPGQKEILVIRTILKPPRREKLRANPGPAVYHPMGYYNYAEGDALEHVACLYSLVLPAPNKHTRWDCHILQRQDNWVRVKSNTNRFTIQEIKYASKNPEHPHLPNMELLAPILIFVETPQGLEAANVYPTRYRTAAQKTIWTYDVTGKTIMQLKYDDATNRHRVLAGIDRSVVIVTPQDDRRDVAKFVDMCRCFGPNLREPDPYHDPHRNDWSEDMLTKERKKAPTENIKRMTLPSKLVNSLQRRGVQAIAYDESIGRLCVVPGAGGEEDEHEYEFYMLDFAQAVHPDGRYKEWVKAFSQ